MQLEAAHKVQAAEMKQAFEAAKGEADKAHEVGEREPIIEGAKSWGGCIVDYTAFHPMCLMPSLACG